MEVIPAVDRLASIARLDSSTLQDARVLQPRSQRQVVQSSSALTSAIAYITTSLAMTVLTKYAASSWKFPGSSSLLLVECWATIAYLHARAPTSTRYQPFQGAILRHLPLVTLAKALNMYLSFAAMRHTSLPVYNVLKRLQPVYALCQDRIIRGVRPLRSEFIGVILMFLGTAVTGSGDLDYEAWGYLYALAAAGCQSLYLVLAKRAQDQIPGLTSTDLLYYTAFFNCVIFVPLAGIELPEVLRFLRGDGKLAGLGIFLVPYISVGALLNYATFWCTAANSPLATAVLGSAKGVLSTIVGVIAFDAKLTPVGWLGWFGSALGGLVYSAARTIDRRKSS